MEIVRRKRTVNWNSRGDCVLLSGRAEGAAYAHDCIATVLYVSTKGRNGRWTTDNNELRGHMILVPVFGLWHCSPELPFCLSSPIRLNNVVRNKVRRRPLPPTSITISIPQAWPNRTLHPFQVPPSRHPFLFYSVSPRFR